MKAILGIFSFFMIINLQAQHISFEEEWAQNLGSDKEDSFWAGVRTPDGGIILVGETTPKPNRDDDDWWMNKRNRDGWVVKLDATGKKEWESVSGGKEDDRLNDVIATPQGDFVATGTITLNNEKMGWVIKIGTDGRKLWEKTYSAGLSNNLQKAINTRDGGILLVGATYSIQQENFEGWMLKLDANGNTQWEITDGGPHSDQFRDVVTLNDGSYAVAGVSSIDGKEDFNGWVVRFDANGKKLKEQKIGEEGKDLFASLTYTRDGGVAVIGATTNEESGEINGWLVKLNQELELEWEKKYDYKNIIQLKKIQPTADGGYLIIGTKNITQTQGYDEWVMKLDRRWKRVWDNEFSFTDVDIVNDLIQLDDNHFVFLGAKQDNQQQAHEGWVASLKVISPKMKIEEYVYENIETWSKRGEFEKTDVYLNRVNETTRLQQATAFEQEITERLKNQMRQSFFTEAFKISKYDPDNESYLLTYQDDEFIIPVPLQEANLFKRVFNNALLSKVDFILSGEYLRVSHFELEHPEFSKSYVWDYTLDYPYEPSKINYAFGDISVEKKDRNITTRGPRSAVDTDIPNTGAKRPNAYALIIGNEDYSTYQPGLNTESDVQFAINDAEIFREYCINTFGVPARNITYLKNATLAQMTSAITKLEQLIEIAKGEAEVYVYYAGHGFPEEKTKEAYIMPVDVSGANVEIAIKLNDFYNSLTKHPSKRITVFLDACFSGAGRGAGLLAMRGVKIRPKNGAIKGNMVVFASSTGEESSGPFYEKQHGLFTYFLLEKINATRGNLTYKELADHLANTIPREAVLINNKRQTPQILFGNAVSGAWEGWKF